MSNPVRIRVYVECGHAGGAITDIVEFDRDEWEAMTPLARQNAADEAAQCHAQNYINYGATFLDPADDPS